MDAAHPACAQRGGQPRGEAPPARCRKHGHAQWASAAVHAAWRSQRQHCSYPSKSRPVPCSKAEWTAPGLFQNRCLVRHTRLFFATSRQPAFAQFPILVESKSFSRTNLWRVAGARFLRLGPRQATLWHGRRHKPSYPRRVPGVAPRAARAGRAPPARTRPQCLCVSISTSRRCPLPCPLPVRPARNAQRRRFPADWRRGHPGQAHWRHHRHNSPRGTNLDMAHTERAGWRKEQETITRCHHIVVHRSSRGP